jgi:hypothetical protein
MSASQPEVVAPMRAQLWPPASTQEVAAHRNHTSRDRTSRLFAITDRFSKTSYQTEAGAIA